MDDYEKGYEPAITFGRYANERRGDAQHDKALAIVAFLERFAGKESDFDRRKRLQRDTLATIESFSAGDRLSRDAVHDRDALR